jgi:type II secretion system protein G
MKKRTSWPSICAGLLLAAGCRPAPEAYRPSVSAQLSLITQSLQWYHLERGDYPTTDEGLKALSQPARRRDGTPLGGTWIEPRALVDPWGTPFQYRYPGTHRKDRPDLWSNGPDKQPNTADDILVDWPEKQPNTLLETSNHK